MPEDKSKNPDDPYHTEQPPLSTYPKDAIRNNAKGNDLDKEVIERMKIRELCEGWGVYRDAADWKQGNIDEFIEASKAGFEKGSKFMYILHRIIGSQVDMNRGLTRAVCKMKITITCRFTFDDIEMDNDADCRFFFFVEKRGNRWGVVFYTLLFDKDKFKPVNPEKIYSIPEDEVKQYPSGYKYLAWAENKISQPPKMNLNAHGPEKDVLYGKMKAWLENKSIRPDLTGEDDPDWKP
ncbi:hypothetical protein E4T49_07677 [Aureobasidium sp. EXF-10728]|nr:hypothetical protein E4T49_07677 [Aureobasidium sp. EXF-10728]